MTTQTASKEQAAMKRVENAARRWLRYPNDVAPRRALAGAIQNLDRVRKEKDSA